MTAPLVVVGDALLDVDLVGTASRLSPDAPVPVVEDVARRERPGGAALAAVIAAAATSREVVLVAPIDSDDGAERLRRLLDGRVRLVAIPATGGTAVKQRVRVGDHSVVRLDSGDPVATLGALPDEAVCIDSPWTATVQECHLVALHLVCAAFDAAVLADPPRVSTASRVEVAR